ncbi:LOW QUALITY PROTEIN: antiviral innate immune response effector IFIT1-like, partial [Saccoglossus kowalevskii]
MTTSSDNMKEQLQRLPCHFTWNLEDKCKSEFPKYMRYIDQHLLSNPNEMRVPAKALKSFLYMSDLEGNSTKYKKQSLKWIDEALRDNKMTTSSDNMKEQLQRLPCHFTWNLEDKCKSEFPKYMRYIDQHLQFNPNEMRVPAKALKSFLYMSDLEGNSTKYKKQSLKWIDEALRDNKLEIGNNDWAIGDKVVLLADKAWISYLCGNLQDVQRLISEIDELQIQLTEKGYACRLAHEAFALHWFSRTHISNAIQCYKLALSMFRDNVDWLFGYARAISKIAHEITDKKEISAVYKEEEDSLIRILQLKPDHGLARVYLARLQITKGSQDDAIRNVEIAVELDGNNSILLQRAGQAYRIMHKFDEAIKLLKKAIKFDPNSSIAHHQLGIIYKQMYYTGKNTDQDLSAKSIQHLKKALESDPGNFAAKIDLAKVSIHSGVPPEEVKKIFIELLECDDSIDRANAHCNYGKFPYHQGEKQSAAEQYKLAMNVKPGSWGAIESAKLLKLGEYA